MKEAVVFSTSAMAERGLPEIKKRLEKRGIKVCDENFYCRGEFRSLHKGKPDAEDLAEAAVRSSGLSALFLFTHKAIIAKTKIPEVFPVLIP